MHIGEDVWSDTAGKKDGEKFGEKEEEDTLCLENAQTSKTFQSACQRRSNSRGSPKVERSPFVLPRPKSREIARENEIGSTV